MITKIVTIQIYHTLLCLNSWSPMNNYLPADQGQCCTLELKSSQQWLALDIPHYHKMPIKYEVPVSLHPVGSHHTSVTEETKTLSWSPWSWWSLPTQHILSLWYAGLFPRHAGHGGLSHHNTNQVCAKLHMLVREKPPSISPLILLNSGFPDNTILS